MSILITGGAGYIGNATVRSLIKNGESVVIVDDLSTGHAEAVPEAAQFYRGKAGDRALIAKLVASHGVTSCIHFAGSAYVGESMANPAKYFLNNTVETHSLLGALLEADVRDFVFSSTCATYGDPVRLPIDETHPQAPVNPYGWSKLMIEKMLASYAVAYGLRYMALRYFNAAGATDSSGEDHDPETHLIPLVLRTAAGNASHVEIYGNEHPTPDGTCIRDFVHIADLAAAHTLALEYLKSDGESMGLNIGSGLGSSVLEVIRAAEEITGKSINYVMVLPRAGDPPRLVADCSLAKKALGFETQHSDLKNILTSAWSWSQTNPHGYP